MPVIGHPGVSMDSGACRLRPLRQGTVMIITCIRWLLVAGVAMLCAAASAGRPNILFAIADDASYPYMGAYGTNWVRCV